MLSWNCDARLSVFTRLCGRFFSITIFFFFFLAPAWKKWANFTTQINKPELLSAVTTIIHAKFFENNFNCQPRKFHAEALVELWIFISARINFSKKFLILLSKVITKSKAINDFFSLNQEFFLFFYYGTKLFLSRLWDLLLSLKKILFLSSSVLRCDCNWEKKEVLLSGFFRGHYFKYPLVEFKDWLCSFTLDRSTDFCPKFY